MVPDTVGVWESVVLFVQIMGLGAAWVPSLGFGVVGVALATPWEFATGMGV